MKKLFKGLKSTSPKSDTTKLKMNELLIHITTWVKPTDVTLNERRLTHTHAYYRIPCMWHGRIGKTNQQCSKSGEGFPLGGRPDWVGPVGAFQGAGNLCLIWGRPSRYVCKKLSSYILKMRTLHDQLYLNLKIILRRKKIQSSARFGNPLHGNSII